jgi:hypothetical protein
MGYKHTNHNGNSEVKESPVIWIQEKYGAPLYRWRNPSELHNLSRLSGGMVVLGASSGWPSITNQKANLVGSRPE